MAYTTRVEWETLRTFDTSTFSGGGGVYLPIGTPLLYPSFVLKIVNTSNVLVLISNDGINDKDLAPSTSFFLNDEVKTIRYESVPKGTQFYVKGVTGTGLVYLVSQYIIPG